MATDQQLWDAINLLYNRLLKNNNNNNNTLCNDVLTGCNNDSLWLQVGYQLARFCF